MRFLTFIHRSPFATWNSLQAWIRESGSLPDEVVVAHVKRVEEHAKTVTRGVIQVLEHYEARDPESQVRRLVVSANELEPWQEALRGEFQRPGPWIVDITPSRTIAKLAVTSLAQNERDIDLFYLDVADYRYEAKPFPWVPYNLQRLWHLNGPEGGISRPAGARGLRPSPGARPVARVPGLLRVDAGGHRETRVPWEALVVLLNEAAAHEAGGRASGQPRFTLKLPAFGVTLAEYDLVSRRFRLRPYQEILRALEEATQRLGDPWKNEIPLGNHVLECLATARLLPYKDQDDLMDELHSMAAETRGPNPGVAPRALALDTNLFYFDFITSLSRAAGLPTIRVPVVASSITRAEIRNQMAKRFDDRALPQMLQDAQIKRPLAARLAHAAHEEFELLRTRCRMDIVTGNAATTDNGENDRRILMDLASHRDRERQDLVVLSNDRGFISRAERDARGLEVRHVDFQDPDECTQQTADVDQVAYLVYRLALGFGRVSLKGLSVEILGEPLDTDQGKEPYIHEQVRLRFPDATWAASFLHELELRRRLDALVRQARLWLP